MKAKSEVTDVMMDLSNDVSSLPESEVPVDTSVAEMTPVSSAFHARSWSAWGAM